jgi:ssDNA-binding Zn-finger/Zn-ribbon topoisomerase 1
VCRLVIHFMKLGKPLDLDELLPLAERDWIDGLHRTLPADFPLPQGAPGAFTEGTFYPAFQKDLARARESVVIFSPFATSSGTTRWVDALRAAMARGVRVRVLTRPPMEFGGGPPEEVAELVRGLRDLGVAVDLRARMHEKIAILDGRILWHGSLNILSHHDTHESMLRLESPAVCQQLGRLVRTPTRRRDEAGASPLDAPENPACPKCGGPTVWNDGRYGIYFECEKRDCGGKVDPRRRQNQRKTATGGDRSRKIQRVSTKTGRSCPHPGCSGRLAIRSGRFGRFLGCTNYPGCRYTENLE